MAKKIMNMKKASGVFNSFGDLGAALGIVPYARKERDKTCNRCGSNMVHLPGTNVYLCEGKSEDGDDCGNRIFSRVRTAF